MIRVALSEDGRLTVHLETPWRCACCGRFVTLYEERRFSVDGRQTLCANCYQEPPSEDTDD